MNFVAIVLIGFYLNAYNVFPLSLTNISRFPHNLHKYFNFTLNYLNDTHTSTVKLIIQISDRFGKRLDEASFDYGIKNEIDETYSSEFITIPIWEKNSKKKTIFSSLLFHKRCDKQFIGIYKTQESSNEIQKEFLENLGESTLIYQSVIKLIVPVKLKLIVKSIDGRLNEFNEGQIAIASCKVIGGIQKSVPIFINVTNFTIKQSSLSVERMERKFEFIVSLSDHMKEIICKSEENIQKTFIKVFHPPNKIKLEPEIKDQFFNGTSVVCDQLNGYPVPITQWKFIYGPQNAHKMYKIIQGGKVLKITVEKFDKSFWIFNCTARNILPSSIEWFNKTISFVIVENNKSKQWNFKKFQPIRESEKPTNHNELLFMKVIFQNMTVNYAKLIEKIENLTNVNKNFSIALKEIQKMNAKLRRGIFELKKTCLNCQNKEKERSNNKKEIFESGMKIQKDSNDIKSLKENFDQLKKKINEITNRINKFSHSQHVIKIDKPKVNLMKLPKKLTGFPPFNILPSNEWKINQIHYKRRKGFPIFGNFFYADYNANKMKMIFFPNGYQKRINTHLSVILQVIFGVNDEFYKPFQGDVIIGLYNSHNGYLNRIVKKSLEITLQSDHVCFDFQYDELSLSGVLMNDEIIIKCFITVKY